MTEHKRSIDLNADLGEGEAGDAVLLGIVTSCNIACGGHTGDVDTMAETIALANTAGVVVGAHPSYPDREGFGRRSGFIEAAELVPELIRQLQALQGVADAADVEVRHVKPHGALYNDAATDVTLAEAVCDALQAINARMRMVGPPRSALERTARERGIGYVAEGFADRAYEADGSLSPRSRPGSVIADATVAADQACAIALESAVHSRDGTRVELDVQTLCIHGDSPGAIAMAGSVRRALEAAGVTVCAVGEGGR